MYPKLKMTNCCQLDSLKRGSIKIVGFTEIIFMNMNSGSIATKDCSCNLDQVCQGCVQDWDLHFNEDSNPKLTRVYPEEPGGAAEVLPGERWIF